MYVEASYTYHNDENYHATISTHMQYYADFFYSQTSMLGVVMCGGHYDIVVTVINWIIRTIMG